MDLQGVHATYGNIKDFCGVMSDDTKPAVQRVADAYKLLFAQLENKTFTSTPNNYSAMVVELQNDVRTSETDDCTQVLLLFVLFCLMFSFPLKNLKTGSTHGYKR